MFHESMVEYNEVFALDDASINYERLMQSGCRFQNIMSSSLTIEQLNQRGVNTLDRFRSLGMDVFDLNELVWTQSLIRLFGQQAVRNSFIVTGQDVMAIFPGDACDALGVTITTALDLCTSTPLVAEAILRIGFANACAFEDVSIKTLVNTGMKSTNLNRAGLSITYLVNVMQASSDDLICLGYNKCSRGVRPCASLSVY